MTKMINGNEISIITKPPLQQDEKSKEKRDDEENPPPMSRARILKNLMVVSSGFFFPYLPFQSLANLQSTLNTERNVGVVSQTIMFATFILSALFLPKLIIKKLGFKYALLACILAYVPYFAANFHPSIATFVPTAVLLGLGGAPLWSAKCTYVNEIGILYAAHEADTADVKTSRFFGVFYLVFQNTQIWGNLISFNALRPRGLL